MGFPHLVNVLQYFAQFFLFVIFTVLNCLFLQHIQWNQFSFDSHIRKWLNNYILLFEFFDPLKLNDVNFVLQVSMPKNRKVGKKLKLLMIYSTLLPAYRNRTDVRIHKFNFIFTQGKSWNSSTFNCTLCNAYLIRRC